MPRSGMGSSFCRSQCRTGVMKSTCVSSNRCMGVTQSQDASRILWQSSAARHGAHRFLRLARSLRRRFVAWRQTLRARVASDRRARGGVGARRAQGSCSGAAARSLEPPLEARVLATEASAARPGVGLLSESARSSRRQRRTWLCDSRTRATLPCRSPAAPGQHAEVNSDNGFVRTCGSGKRCFSTSPCGL